VSLTEPKTEALAVCACRGIPLSSQTTAAKAAAAAGHVAFRRELGLMAAPMRGLKIPGDYTAGRTVKRKSSTADSGARVDRFGSFESFDAAGPRALATEVYTASRKAVACGRPV
jgi:hypothetical protein